MEVLTIQIIQSQNSWYKIFFIFIFFKKNDFGKLVAHGTFKYAADLCLVGRQIIFNPTVPTTGCLDILSWINLYVVNLSIHYTT